MNADISWVISTLQIRLLLQANCKPEMKNCFSFLFTFLLNHVCVLYYLWFSCHSRVTSFIYLAFPQKEVNPYSHQHQFSPNNLHTLSREMDMRINKMISKEIKILFWSFIKLSYLLLFGNIWRWVWRICMWILGLSPGGGGGGVLWISSDRDDWRIFRGRKILASIFLHSLI